MVGAIIAGAVLVIAIAISYLDQNNALLKKIGYQKLHRQFSGELVNLTVQLEFGEGIGTSGKWTLKFSMDEMEISLYTFSGEPTLEDPFILQILTDNQMQEKIRAVHAGMQEMYQTMQAHIKRAADRQ